MSDISELLGSLVTESSQLVSQSQSDQAVQLLKAQFETLQSHPVYLQSLGEALLENGNLEEAQDVLTRACELDPQASQGVEKFLYLGEIMGAKEGIELLQTGLNKLLSQMDILKKQGISDRSQEFDDSFNLLISAYGNEKGIKEYLLKKMDQGIFAMIEIWMTDLCDELEAEQQCEQLIDQALVLDPENPEAWSLLASIRISQMRNDDAIKAITKAWELFSKRKTLLEDISNIKNESIDVSDAQMEYLELVEPIVTLAKYSMEMGLFEESIGIASSVQDINERSVESYYLEAFANYLNAKRIQNRLSPQDGYKVSQDFAKYPLKTNIDESDDSFVYLKEARRALTSGFKLLQIDEVAEETDDELKKTIHSLLKQLGGPLLKEKDDSGVDETNWEAQII
ncbi:hypothetical protein FOA43_002188 [Brettanomyces nanus]|uniref:Tetratricopeptide repeat protein n=1 Tax=Eeniella nana TaxID=13502 RepID=A0A875S460_EENNA|nr:uncharacterized protein FOA43_002188 [Brettanomyces nanus]QPG74852.1 hypothetical protein FOA43_002188 [Brettanomyces nanus]